MPPEFSTGFFGGNQPFWHNEGNVILEDVVTTREALKLAELDYEVELRGLLVENTIDGIPDRVEGDWSAVVRKTDNKVLGIVGSRYVPFQNWEGFEFMDDLLRTKEAKWHTAGSLKGGSIVWMLARLPQEIYIKGMKEEQVRPFILFTQGHDGKTPITIKLTPVRVGCMNTLTLALAGAERQYTVRHYEGVAPKVAEARKVLGIAHKYFDQLEVVASTMVDTRITEKEIVRVLDKLIPLKGAKTAWTEKNARAERELILDLLKVDNLANVRGTQWALLNAVADWRDHHSKSRNTDKSGGNNQAENRMRRIIEDTSMLDKTLALLQPQLASPAAKRLVRN